MESKMLEALRRYIQDYGWNWGIVHSLINRKFGTDYTLEELQHFYIREPGIFPCSQVFWSIDWICPDIRIILCDQFIILLRKRKDCNRFHMKHSKLHILPPRPSLSK